MLVLAAAGLPAGCERQGADTGESIGLPAGVDDAFVPDTIEGSYRVSRLNGRPLERTQPLLVTIDEAVVTFSSGCIRRRWTHAYAQGALDPNESPMTSCRRGPSPTEAEAIAVLGAPGFLLMTPEGALVLQGERGVLILSSP
jgi:hypothetical protein